MFVSPFNINAKTMYNTVTESNYLNKMATSEIRNAVAPLGIWSSPSEWVFTLRALFEFESADVFKKVAILLLEDYHSQDGKKSKN